MKSIRRGLLVGSAIVLMFVLIALSLVFAPSAAGLSPMTQRMLYYHVPAAWVAYLAFGVTALMSGLHLARPTRGRDALARASAEVGTAFALIALFTGLLWSRVEWFNYSPLEDPKVITTVVLIFAYFAYFALRASIDERVKRGRLAAVFGMLAFIGVPLSYVASRASIHPDFTRPEQTLDPRLGWILLAATFVFTVLYAALVTLRYDLALAEERILDLEESQ